MATPPTSSSTSSSTHVVDSSSPMEIDWISYKLLTNAQWQHQPANNLCPTIVVMTMCLALAQKRGYNKHHIMWMGLKFYTNWKIRMPYCNYASTSLELTIVSKA
jgi:hypothetical protein